MANNFHIFACYSNEDNRFLVWRSDLRRLWLKYILYRSDHIFYQFEILLRYCANWLTVKCVWLYGVLIENANHSHVNSSKNQRIFNLDWKKHQPNLWSWSIKIDWHFINVKRFLHSDYVNLPIVFTFCVWFFGVEWTPPNKSSVISQWKFWFFCWVP